MKCTNNTPEQMERFMLYLKTKGGVTIPLLRKRKTWFFCYKTKKKLENEIGDLNGHLVINH